MLERSSPRILASRPATPPRRLGTSVRRRLLGTPARRGLGVAQGGPPVIAVQVLLAILVAGCGPADDRAADATASEGAAAAGPATPSSSADPRPAEADDEGHSSTSSPSSRPSSADAAPSTPAAPSLARAPDMSPLANLLTVAPGVLSGGMPRGDAGFSGLAGLGVTTVISVDAAAPDLERAAQYGMRYVHVPTRYASITPAEQAAVARAIAEAEGTVYVHCHHGKHRGPAAVAAALRCLDRLTPDEAEQFIADAGTSLRYPGLWEAVRTAEPMDEATRLALAPELPERADPATFIAAMADADRHWDNLRLLAAGGFAPDPDHPDLVPAAEAGILADLFRMMAEQVEARELGRGFVAELERSASLASLLEEQLEAGTADLDAAVRSFAEIGDACTSCHRVYRDSE